MTRRMTFVQAVRDALAVAMEQDSGVLCFGLGVTDPKCIFGTTAGLAEKFGAERVFDMPTSENAMTGVAIGAALQGLRPVMVHQRLDFALLSLDQLINNAAKWHYMFGGLLPCPITIRMILGRGWGQGPTHSQNLQALFTHIPGLKVVMPTSAADAKGLLLASIFDDNPVIFLEHRWIHNSESDVPEGDYRVPLGQAHRLAAGRDVTIVGYSYMSVEALRVAEALAPQGVTCDVIDLRTLRPLDWDLVLGSVRQTGRLVALDTGCAFGSVAGEIVARASMECFKDLKAAPARIALPDFPVPTSPALTRDFYPGPAAITAAIGRMLGRDLQWSEQPGAKPCPHDVPGAWFKGPF